MLKVIIIFFIIGISVHLIWIIMMTIVGIWGAFKK